MPVTQLRICVEHIVDAKRGNDDIAFNSIISYLQKFPYHMLHKIQIYDKWKIVYQ